MTQESSSIRYRFHIDEGCEIPPQWNYPGIVILDREGGWLTCLLRNLSPAEAIRTLVENKIAVIEAERLSGGLEDLYLTYTTRGTV